MRSGSWSPRLPDLAQCRPGPRGGGGADQSEAQDPGLGQSELRAAGGHPGPGQQQQHHHDIRLRRGQGRPWPRLPSPKCLWRLDTSPEQATTPGHHAPAPLRLRWPHWPSSFSQGSLFPVFSAGSPRHGQGRGHRGDAPRHQRYELCQHGGREGCWCSNDFFVRLRDLCIVWWHLARLTSNSIKSACIWLITLCSIFAKNTCNLLQAFPDTCPHETRETYTWSFTFSQCYAHTAWLPSHNILWIITGTWLFPFSSM